jgi:predicted NAD-dependent protein-ADP-ribosyltransferase YbiA (DUF1768 family)
LKIDPAADGITHINVYSNGKTALGRFLSNFAYSEIQTQDGQFKSVEGYWYWLGTEASLEREALREAVGAHAKELGRALGAKDWQSSDEFKRKICSAISIKIRQNSGMLLELKNSRLPLAHYYVYGDKVVRVAGAQWILDYIQSIRTSLQQEG